MKVRAIELTNVRRFAGKVARIEGIGDGITVLCEPNEFGKSTFFDALHALFFERHRGTKAAVKALQPHAGGAPEVALEIDLPHGHFRIEKRWLSRATARVHQDGRIIAQDDEAEAWIDRILGNGLSGPSGLLWVRQGLLGMEPEGSSTSEKNERERALAARRDLLSSVTGEIDLMTGGRRLDAVMARVGQELGELATSTGRAKSGGEWARAVEEAETLRLLEAELAAKAAQLSGHLARRAEAQRALRELEDPEADRQRQEALAVARAAHADAAAHVEKVAEARRGLKLATLTEEATRDNIQRLETLSERLTTAETDLARARDRAAQAEARAEGLAITDRAAGAALAAAQEAGNDLRQRLASAQRARLALATRDKAIRLAQSVARAEELRSTLEAHRAQRALLVVNPDVLAQAEQAREEHDRLLAQLAAQSVSVSFHYDGALRASADADLRPPPPHRRTRAVHRHSGTTR